MKQSKGQELTPGQPCNHPGCLSHISHPCESCGRIAGRFPLRLKIELFAPYATPYKDDYSAPDRLFAILQKRLEMGQALCIHVNDGTLIRASAHFDSQVDKERPCYWQDE